MFTKKLLELLSDNKRYPKYQHERRIDIFLNFFLPGILEKQFGHKIDLVIPEFPLKKPNSSLATNIDYLAYSKSANVAYICEFKTDPLSFKKEQLQRYRQAVKAGWNSILSDVRLILKKTSESYRSKYQYLLDQANLIPIGVTLKVVYFTPKRTNFDSHIEDIAIVYLEDLAEMDINTDYPEEWRIVKQFFGG